MSSWFTARPRCAAPGAPRKPRASCAAQRRPCMSFSALPAPRRSPWAGTLSQCHRENNDEGAPVWCPRPVVASRSGVAVPPNRPARRPYDTDALMDELRARVASKKARGLYRADALVRETLDQGGGDEAYERLRANAVLHQSLAVPASTRPGVGKVIEFVKRFILRAAFLNVQGIIEQQSRVNGDLIAELRRLADDVDGLRAQRSARSGGSPAQQDAVVDRRARGVEGAQQSLLGPHSPGDAAAHRYCRVCVVDGRGRCPRDGAHRRRLARVVSGAAMLMAPGRIRMHHPRALITSVGLSEARRERRRGHRRADRHRRCPA